MTVPSAPTNLTATSISDSRIDLDWDPVNESAVDQYNIYRDTSSGVSVTGTNFVASTGLSTTSFADTGLAAGTTYYYVVTAVDTDPDPDDESSASNEASDTTEGESLEGRVTDLENTTSQNENILRDQGFITDAAQVVETIFPNEPNPEELADLLDAGPPEVFYIWYLEAGRTGRPDGGPGLTYGWGTGGMTAAQAARDRWTNAHADASTTIKDEWFPSGYSPALDGLGMHADDVGDRSAYGTWQGDWGPVHGAKGLTEYVGLPIKTIEVHSASAGVPAGARTMLTVDRTETLRLHYDANSLTASQASTAADELAAILEGAYSDLQTNYNQNWTDYFGFTSVPVTIE